MGTDRDDIEALVKLVVDAQPFIAEGDTTRVWQLFEDRSHAKEFVSAILSEARRLAARQPAIGPKHNHVGIAGRLLDSAQITTLPQWARDMMSEAADALIAARQPADGVFGWWMQDSNGVGYFTKQSAPSDLAEYQTTPGYSATPLFARQPAAPEGVDAAALRVRQGAPEGWQLVLAKLSGAAGLMLSEIDTCGHEVDPAYRATLYDAWEEAKAMLAAAPKPDKGEPR